MKTRLLILGMGVVLTVATRAGIIIPGGAFANSGYIPDGSAVGSSGTATAGGLLPSITSISVNLNISGGYNGDLYAYLSYGGVLVPLLNRVGVTGTGGGNAFGYGDAGMNVTLRDSAATDVHFYGNLASPYVYQPDGRAINPLSTPANFDSATASRMNFGSFSGLNPNGTWTLFFADLSAGAQGQVLGWSLDITAEVPEPANVALGIFAGIFLVITLARSRRVRGWLHRRRVAVVEWINAV